jgi:signal transduction histidine kinase/CheY-like chemotaxis protein
MPSAVPVAAGALATEAVAGRLAAVSGRVTAATIDQDGLLRIELRSQNTTVVVRVTNNSHVDRDALIGAMVTARGVADAIVNSDGQVQEYRLWCDSDVSLTVTEPATAPQQLPISSVKQVTMSLAAGTARLHNRVRLRGDVIDDGRGELLFQDATGRMSMSMERSIIPATGNDMWVWAFPELSANGPQLEDAQEQAVSSSRVDANSTIRLAAGIRSMTDDQAAKELPVVLDAVVTYASQADGLLFVQDRSAGIYVDVGGPLPTGIRAGWRVHVEGRTESGFAPSVYHAHVSHTGYAPLPVPVVVSTEGLLSPKMDSQFVPLEGVARSMERGSDFAILHMAAGPVRFTAYLNDSPTLPLNLLGARLRLTGAAGSSFNSRRQFNAVDLHIQSPAQITVLRASPKSFELPVRLANSLSQFSPNDDPGSEVHVRGTVTMVIPAGIFIRDSSGGLEIRTTTRPVAVAGDLVDVAGFLKVARSGAMIEDATAHTLAHGIPPQPTRTTAYQILDGDLDASLVELDASVISHVPKMGEVDLLLNSAGYFFTATMEGIQPLSQRLEPGTRVRVRGICLVQPSDTAENNIPKSFELRLRTVDGIRILTRASWWTAEHASRVVWLGFSLLALALAWVYALRRKVHYQTATIEKKLLIEESLRHQAESASIAKGEFLANMSHEIRTPINGILGFARLALATTKEVETRENLAVISGCASALVGVINDILDLSKIEAGGLTLETIAFSLREEVESAVCIFRPEAERKQLDLQLDFDKNLPAVVKGDPLRLRQILLNLVGNAMKFTSSGFVRVRVEAPSLAADPAALRFTVADSGIGIPLDKQEAVFKAFAQADNSISRLHGGTGLGLTISARLVALAGGELTLESTLGKGTSFHFTLPFAKAEPGSIQRRSDGQPSRAQSALPAMLSFLVAEDNIVNQRLIKKLLEREGHTVQIASDGREAIRMRFDRPRFYDLVLMDVQMPECDGYQATAKIRSLEEAKGLPPIPVVALTAHAMEGDRNRCLEAGMDGYTTKPIVMDALVAEILKCLPASQPASAEPRVLAGRLEE